MIPAEQSEFRVSTSSHPGKGGEINEDRFRLQAFSLTEREKGDSLFAILADGIGAQRAGEVAAELAVESISRAVSQSDASQPTGILQAAIIQAGQAIRYRSEKRPEWNGMGSTCLCAWLLSRRLYIASVGNSRLFLLRHKHLQQLNVPSHHPRHIAPPVKGRRAKKAETEDPLLGYLGSRSPVDVDLRLVLNSNRQEKSTMRNQGLRLQPNDRLLLCSDGVGDVLTSADILDILGNRELANTAEALVDLALEKGSGQNLTALVIAVPPAQPPLLARRVNWKRPIVIALLALLLIFFGLFAWWLWLGQLGPLGDPTPTAISTLTPVATNTPIPE
ncbi:MAG: protein phosphatase 2C domain-containing protein [Anaerolineales bacterium]